MTEQKEELQRIILRDNQEMMYQFDVKEMLLLQGYDLQDVADVEDQ